MSTEAKQKINAAAAMVRASNVAAVREIRERMLATAPRCAIRLTPADLRRAGIPSRAAANQLAASCGLSLYPCAGSYPSYIRLAVAA